MSKVQDLPMNYYNPSSLNIAMWGKLITEGKWKPREFDKIIIEFLYYALQGKVSKIMISVPPRHGKSTLVSKIFCSYFLANFPDEQVILSSYSQGLASEFGGEVKDILNYYSDQTLLKAGLATDSKAKNKFHMSPPFQGQMLSVGAAGSILGFGAGLFIIDDPIKNVAEAESDVLQDKLNSWFQATAKTRLQKRSNGLPPIMLVIAQRLHVNDLQGIIKKNEQYIDAKEALELLRDGKALNENIWVDLTLPAICENPEQDLLGRKEGEVLWPEQQNYETLMAARRSMGSYLFNAVYQGNPSLRQGNIFQREWFYDEGEVEPHCIIEKDELPEDLPHIRYWDFAANSKSKSKGMPRGDETSGVLTGYDGTTLYVLDLINNNFTPKQVNETFIRTAHKDGKNTRVFIEEEPGSGSRILINMYRNNPTLKGWNIRPDKVRGPKNIRSFTLENMAESRNIRFVRASWNTKMIEQLISFTGDDGERDDIVDSLTGSARMWVHKKAKIIL